MALESIMPPGPAEQPAKTQCSTQPNIFTPTTASHGAQGLYLRRRSVAGLANLKNNSSAAQPLRIAGFAGSICGRMSTPGHAVTGPQSPPNHILKAMARYRVSQSEEGVSAPLGAIMPLAPPPAECWPALRPRRAFCDWGGAPPQRNKGLSTI